MSGNRPEARPLPLSVLDHYQVQAIERISETLLNAMEALEHIPSEAAELDPFRASNNFFLSGEAGGGKTTVYLSLRKALENEASDIDKNKFPRLSDLRSKSKQLVWLEQLDLESAPEVGNFLAAVLVRIEDRIGKEAYSDNLQRRPGLLDRDASDFLQEFERLQNDVVLAWEGNVPQRAEQLDPDIYSLEVLRAAKATLQVKPRLQKAITGILEEERSNRKRLFVLPIDDFYLQPSSSLKLLRLLRMIAVPQLFLLVMGDLDTLEELVYQDMLGKLVALAGDQALQADPRQRMVLSSTATLLSSTSLRKLIPPGQHYRLAVMHRLAALDFFPERLDPPGYKQVALRKGQYSLEEMLDLLLVSIPRVTPVSSGEVKMEIVSLLDFLKLRSRADEGKGDDYYTYSGLAVLDLPPREVVDLWYTINNVLPDSSGSGTQEKKEPKVERLRKFWSDAYGEESAEQRGFEATLEVVVETTNAAILGQTYIGKEGQAISSKAVRGHRGYNRRTFVTEYLRAESDRVPLIKIALETGGHLVTCLHQGWFFYPNHRGTKEPEYMAPRPTAWLTVLHDLMALSGDDRLAGAPLTPDRFNFRLVEVITNGEPIGWPTPRWASFWHFDRLGFAWRRVADKARSLKKQLSAGDLVEWLAFHWVRYITDVMLSNCQEIVVLPESEIHEQWEKLVSDTVVLHEFLDPGGEGEPEAREMVRDWLIDLAAMLLSKEFAMPESVWDRFQHSPLLREFWQQEGEAISMALKVAKEKARIEQRAL